MTQREVLPEQGDADWWDELPGELQASINRSLKESEEGIGTPHEEIIEKYGKWFESKGRHNTIFTHHIVYPLVTAFLM